MKKWVLAFKMFVIASILCLHETGAVDFDDFFVGSVTRSIGDGVGEVFNPPANTNDSIVYRLYTRSNPKEPCFIEPTPEEFDKCAFDPKLETKILIHGFIVTVNNDNTFGLIKDALLKHAPYNVIYVDWSRYNVHPYNLAVMNTVPVGKKVAEMIKFIKKHTKTSCRKFHVVGHSLGAHISGIVGKNYRRLPRITGLDPAGPLYEIPNRDTQLYYTDAKFVDVIHTSDEKTGQGLGKYEPVGTMDFYPNGGQFQPGCSFSDEIKPSSSILTNVESPYYVMMCNHVMALKFFQYSIEDCANDYLSTNCENYEKLPACMSQGNKTSKMGFHAKRIKDLDPKSKFYLKTTATEPFC